MEQPVNGGTQRLLEALSEMLQHEGTRQQMVKQIGCSLQLIVGSHGCLVVDVRGVNSPTVPHENDTKTKVDATLEISDEAFLLVCAGRLSPAHAFMTGRLKITGDVLLAMKSDALFKLLRKARPLGHPPKSRL